MSSNSANLSATLNGSLSMGQVWNKNSTLLQPWSCFNPTAERIGKTFTCCLLFVVSMAGNTLIGIAVYKTKTLRKPTNFFIVNMTMSDLLIPILLYPRKVTELHVDSWLISGPLGLILCNLTLVVEYISYGVSIQSLVLIAVDRFGAVVFPLRSPLISSKLSPFFILATWIIVLALSLPSYFDVRLFEFPGGQYCVLTFSESFRPYSLSVNIFFFYLPFIIITTLYIIIYFKLKARKIPGEQSVKIERQRRKRERNVLNMGVAIVLAFILCWLPVNICYLLIHSVADITSPCGFRHFEAIARFLPHVNCAINPSICFIFSGHYRQGLKNITRCFQCDEPRTNQVAP